MPPGRTTPAYVPIEEEPILTPEEQAALDAMNASIVTGAGGGNAPIPPPPTDTTLVPAGTPPPPTQTVTYPTAGVQNNPAGAPEYVDGYGDQVPVASSNQEPVPAPSDSYAGGDLTYQQTYPDQHVGMGSTPTGARGSRQIGGGFQPLPTPTPSSPTINARASDYTALGLDPTEYLRRSYGPPPEPAPLYPNALGGRGPLGPEHVNAKFVGGMGDLGAGARWAPPIPPPPIPPPPEPTTNWWDPITQAAGNVIPGLVQWATPGLESGPANSARQAQDAVGGVLRDASLPPVRQASLDQLNQGLGLTQPDTGISWRDVLSPGDWIPEPQTYRDSRGREMLGVGDTMFLPDPMGGIGTAGFADDAARAVNSVDDAARVANVADDAARMRTTAADEAIPEPPPARPLADAEPVVGSPGSANTTAPAAGAAPRGRTLPRLSKRGVAAAGAGAVVAGGVANNVLQTRPPTGPQETVPAPIQPGEFSPSTNPQTPDEWATASTHDLQLMVHYPPSHRDWLAQTEERPIQDPDGNWRRGIAVKGVTNSSGIPLYVGFIGADGHTVPAGNDVSAAEFRSMLANAAPSDPPIASPDEAVRTSDAGTTVSDVAIPAPSSSGNGAIGHDGDSWHDDWFTASRSSGRGSSQSKDYGSDDGDEFSASDFLDAADGDKRKAAKMAAVANRRRRRGKRKGESSDSQFWAGFPFSRPNSPLREHVLSALQESMNRRQGRS